MADTEEVVVTIEDRAREMGWKPQDEFEGDETTWVNADIFVARAPLFDKIKIEQRARNSVEKQLEQTNKALRELGEHNKRIAEASYKRALAEFRAAKKDALREGDVVMAEEIQERIDEMKPEVVPVIPEYNPSQQKINDWLAENKWYIDNPEMRNVADGVGKHAVASGKNPDEVLALINDRIRKTYPEEFEPVQQRNKNKDEAPFVESRGKTGGGKAPSKFRPTEEQRRFAKAFVASGAGITEEEYYKQLEELGE